MASIFQRKALTVLKPPVCKSTNPTNPPANPCSSPLVPSAPTEAVPAGKIGADITMTPSVIGLPTGTALKLNTNLTILNLAVKYLTGTAYTHVAQWPVGLTYGYFQWTLFPSTTQVICTQYLNLKMLIQPIASEA